MENSNNMGINQYSSSEVPSEIKKWNWGAFMMNIMWGIGNKSYLTLLCLIPLFNIIWIFVCGAKEMNGLGKMVIILVQKNFS